MIRPFHGGNLREAGANYQIEKNVIMDFSANINPSGLSPRARNALISNLDIIHSYPDPFCRPLKKELAAYLGVDEKNILLGNGSCDLIYLATRTFSPGKALIFSPTFSGII